MTSISFTRFASFSFFFCATVILVLCCVTVFFFICNHTQLCTFYGIFFHSCLVFLSVNTFNMYNVVTHFYFIPFMFWFRFSLFFNIIYFISFSFYFIFFFFFLMRRSWSNFSNPTLVFLLFNFFFRDCLQ